MFFLSFFLLLFFKFKVHYKAFIVYISNWNFFPSIFDVVILYKFQNEQILAKKMNKTNNITHKRYNTGIHNS